MKLKITIFSALLCFALSYSQTEFINQDFGENGLLCIDIPGETRKMGDIVKINNEYYGLTDFLNNNLVKFSSGGELLSSFGNNGYMTLNIGPTGGSVYEKNAYLLATPDNTLLMVTSCGGADQNFMVKTDLDGNPVSSFGNNGYVATWNNDIIQFMFAEIIDDEIVLIGTSGNPNNRYIVILKYDLSGDPVSSFGNNGKFTIAINNNSYPGDALYFPESNRVITLAKYLNFEENEFYSLATMYNLSNGLPDFNFGTGGSVYFYSTNGISVNPKTLYSDNANIYIAGWIGLPSAQSGIFINKYELTGQPDNNFGMGGGAYQNIIENAEYISVESLVRTDGHFMLTGHLKPNNSNFEKVFLTRITENGLQDTGFGNNGIIINPLDISSSSPSFKTIIEDNLITVATMSMSCSSDDQPKPAVIQFNTDELSVNENQIGTTGFYPNPVKDLLHFTASGNIEKAEVYDLSGKLVIAENSIANSIDLSKLQSGLYLVRVFENGAISNLKIIKQ